MSRQPAPALLVRPDDVLAAIRSSILLGAVVPGLRAEVEALTADLTELARLRGLAAADRAARAAEVETLGREGDRMAALMEARQAQLATAEEGRRLEQARADALGAEARTLQQLVDRLDREAGTARRQADETRRDADARSRELRERFAAAALAEPPRLGPKTPFGEQKGSLPKPVAGPVLREFGAPDPQGAAARGVVIGSRPRAVVASPCDGAVVYAGPFRTFGRVLIIGAGGGYYLLLAGMDRISVEAGQFVLSGEPVGQMGDASAPAAALGGVETAGPALYVELRKDGGPIDPGPWWSRQGERVRG